MHCKICGIIFVDSPGQTSEHRLLCLCTRLPWCWTEEEAPWISQQLGFLVFHIPGTVMGIALCWSCRCLRKVGGNLLPHIVRALDVTTVVLCCRQAQDRSTPHRMLTASLQTSEWQWIASVFTTWHCTGRYNNLCTADKCLLHNLALWLGCWSGVTSLSIGTAHYIK